MRFAAFQMGIYCFRLNKKMKQIVSFAELRDSLYNLTVREKSNNPG